jgi:hypothetical protein
LEKVASDPNGPGSFSDSAFVAGPTRARQKAWLLPAAP